MAREIDDFAKTMNSLILTFSELSSESNEITAALDGVRDHSKEVKVAYDQMLSMVNHLRDAMHELTTLAGNKADI